MADHRLLEWAAKALELAEFCSGLNTRLMSTDIIIDAEMGKFFLRHVGHTPDDLRGNYGGWKNAILENLPKLDSIISMCHSKARDWREEYDRQKREEEEEERKKKEKENSATA